MTDVQQAVPVAGEDRIVAVTQADRDAVQAFHHTMLLRLMSDVKSQRPKLGDDEGDAGTLVQAFARHRLAALSRLPQPARKADRLGEGACHCAHLHDPDQFDHQGGCAGHLAGAGKPIDPTHTREAEALAGIERIMREGIHENDGPNRIWLDGVPHEGPVTDWAIRTFRKVGDIARAALSQTPPTPSLSTDVQSAATGFHEHDVSLKVAMPASGEDQDWRAKAVAWLRARRDQRPPDSLWSAAGVLADRMEKEPFEQPMCFASKSLATVAAGDDEGVAYTDELLDRVAEAITRAQCPGREGPYGGYDYGHRREDDLPCEGRYVVRDFRDVSSDTFGAWVHQTPDVEVHEAAFDRLTKRHIARAALDAARTIPPPATSRSQHEGASS
jgi:hypothetical protein